MTLDARFLETDGDGTERLAAILHPTQQVRGRALVRGRRRVRNPDPWALNRRGRTESTASAETASAS